MSNRAIEDLIATYAELVDDGDFRGVGTLLANATFTGAAGSVSGRHAIEKMLRDSLILYDDGTPRTKHVTTNIAIETDEEGLALIHDGHVVAEQRDEPVDVGWIELEIPAHRVGKSLEHSECRV